MKEYPSIQSWPGTTQHNVYVFGKYDGSNVRCEFDNKGNIIKFGKRHGLLDDQTPFLIKSKQLIIDKYLDNLAKIIKDNRFQKATCYFEFYGPNSFAGYHVDEQHTVMLFDIDIYKKGLMEPKEFLKLFKNLEIPEVLHYGNFNQEIAEQISNGTLANMPFEGVVCKGPLDKKTGRPLMFKYKNLAWLNKLKENRPTEFESLK